VLHFTPVHASWMNQIEIWLSILARKLLTWGVFTSTDELRDHFRYRQHLNETVSLADQRRLFQDRWGDVCTVLQAA